MDYTALPRLFQAVILTKGLKVKQIDTEEKRYHLVRDLFSWEVIMHVKARGYSSHVILARGRYLEFRGI